MQRLPLGLVDSDGPGEAHGELAPDDLHRKGELRRAHGNARQEDTPADATAREHDHVESARRSCHHQASCPVAQAGFVVDLS